MSVKQESTMQGTLLTYSTGFVLSIILTLLAYYAVTEQIFESRAVSIFVVVLAVVQLLVQLVFFVHLAQEPKPRHHLLALIFTALMVSFLVFGSMWIMYSLDYHHRLPDPGTDSFIIKDEGQ